MSTQAISTEAWKMRKGEVWAPHNLVLILGKGESKVYTSSVAFEKPLPTKNLSCICHYKGTDHHYKSIKHGSPSRVKGDTPILGAWWTLLVSRAKGGGGLWKMSRRPCNLSMPEKNYIKKGVQHFKFSVIGPNLVQGLTFQLSLWTMNTGHTLPSVEVLSPEPSPP